MHKKQIRPIARLHGYWLFRRLLPRMQTWPVERRRAWIFEKLKRTLTLAHQGTPFYRERFDDAGFDPERDFKSPADLAQVPILTKKDVRANAPRLIDRRFLRGSVEANTSGTTGQPMTMRLNRTGDSTAASAAIGVASSTSTPWQARGCRKAMRPASPSRDTTSSSGTLWRRSTARS